MIFNFKRDCRNILRHIKTPKQRGGCMPYDTGHLARMGCSGRFVGDSKFTFTMNTGSDYKHGAKDMNGKYIGNPFGASYAIPLNEGSVPHDIPNAFGMGGGFGIGGNYNGKFHPGSLKHVGFYDGDYDNSILGYTLYYFAKHYFAVVKAEGVK